MKEIKFKPGSIVIQSSESESNVIDSSRPAKVIPGAVEDETSILKMKSLEPLSVGFGGSFTISGVDAEDTSIVVTAWSSTKQHSDPSTLVSYAVIRGYL